MGSVTMAYSETETKYMSSTAMKNDRRCGEWQRANGTGAWSCERDATAFN